MTSTPYSFSSCPRIPRSIIGPTYSDTNFSSKTGNGRCYLAVSFESKRARMIAGRGASPSMSLSNITLPAEALRQFMATPRRFSLSRRPSRSAASIRPECVFLSLSDKGHLPPIGRANEYRLDLISLRIEACCSKKGILYEQNT